MNQNNEYTVGRPIRLLAAFALPLLLALPARPQDASEDPTYELSAFSVSASRLEVPIQRVGSSVDVLDRYELGSGQDIFLVDALREVPGLLLRNNGGPGGVFGITTRGLSSNRPTVLVNGIEVSNPSSGEIINLGNLFVGGAERVEALRGPQSSLYGADALAGVISVDTLAPGARPGGRLLLGYGSYDTYDYAIGHSGSRGKFSWAVDAMQHESEGFSSQPAQFGEGQAVDGTYNPAWEDDDTYDNTTLSVAARYELDEQTSAFASALYNDSYAEFDPGDPSPWTLGVGGEHYAKNEQLFLVAGVDKRIQDNWTTSAKVAYTDVDSMSYSDGFGFSATGERLKYSWLNEVEATEGWSLVAGFEYEDEKNLSDLGERSDTSVFVENVIAVGEGFDLTLGARRDDNSVYGGETTYRATFSKRIESLDARLRGSLGTSFQAPSFFQLFSAFYGNPDLRPESGRGWDLGIEKRFLDGKLFASSTAFGNKVTDKIVWSGRYANVAEYESVGVENALRYYASDALRFKLAHTYSDAEENGMVEALRVPRNVVSLSVAVQAWEGKLGLNLDALAVSSQYSNPGSNFSGVKMEGYDVVNLAASYQLRADQTLWVRVGNLFDADYQEVAGYQTAGLNLLAGVRLAF